MKTVKQILETTYMPKGGDEKKFWDKHVRKLLDHPVAEPTQFKASTKKSTTNAANRDEASSESVYEAAFNDTAVHTKRADKEPVISRGIDPKTRKGVNVVKKGATGEIKIGEETELDEAISTSDYSTHGVKSKFGGYRAEIKHKTKGHTMYSGAHGYDTAEKAKGEADAYLKVYSQSGDRAAGMAARGHAEKHAMSGPFAKNVKEEVELDESITSMSDARLKFHATKSVPHGSYTRKEIEAEHNRRKKTDGVAYASVKPSLNEDADLDEKVKNPYAIGMAAAMKQAGDTPPLKKSTIVKGHEIAKSIKKEAMDPVGKADADIDNDGDVDKSDKYLHNRRKAIGKALKTEGAKESSEANHKKYIAGAKKAKEEFKEESEQIDELSKSTLGSYVAKASSAAASDAAKYGQQGSSEKGLDHFRKAYSRLQNIKKAAGKLAKEEVEQIDELSPSTLHSYIKKATPDIVGRTMSAVSPNQSAETKKHASKLGKRISGITSASGRLSDKANAYQYEEVELVNMKEASEIHDKVHDISSLQKHFDGRVAYDAASHSPAMMVRKANDGKKYHLINTGKGYHAKLAEEVEQIDEIGDTPAGRKALKAVIARAPEKAANSRLRSDVLGRRQFDPDVSSAHSERYGHAADKHYRKYQLAVKGAARAVDRLTKEEVEQIDELSPKTLGSYIKKSSMRVASKSNHAGEIEGRGDSNISSAARSTLKKLNRKTVNSLVGIDRATNRITKEDLDEAFKAGQMKLKDGSSVTVSKDCAESLNSLFTQLSPANKTKMEERLMSSPKGYNEILSFAENIDG